jgi:hypothetical protein
VADFDDHHVLPVVLAERDRGLREVGHLLHHRTSQLAHVECRKVGVAQSEHAGAERIFLAQR